MKIRVKQNEDFSVHCDNCRMQIGSITKYLKGGEWSAFIHFETWLGHAGYFKDKRNALKYIRERHTESYHKVEED